MLLFSWQRSSLALRLGRASVFGSSVPPTAMTDRKGDGMLTVIARALHERCSMWPWDQISVAEKALVFGEARAALMAMREMPVETQKAIFDARDGFVHEMDIPAVWTMGIDAILAESDTPCPTAAHTVG